MQSFSKWLDEEYLVAKLTLLSGQKEGRHRTQEETNKLFIEYDLMERIHGEYQRTGSNDVLFDTILKYETALERMARKQQTDINTVVEVVKRLTPEQARHLMDSLEIEFTDVDLKIEDIKRKIRIIRTPAMKDLENDIQTILPFINE